MKRSEMLDIIIDVLESNRNSQDYCFIANDILTRLEIRGMAPPLTRVLNYENLLDHCWEDEA